MKTFSFQHVVVVIVALFLGLLVLIVANILEVHGILQAGDVIIFWLGLVVLLFLLGYILAPILLYWNHWLSANLDYEEFHPGREVVPEEVWSHIRETVSSLDPCGFKLVGHFRLSGATPGAMAYVTLMQSADQLTLGRIITVLTRKKKGTGEGALLFCTETSDGTEILTVNNRKLSLHPRRKKQLVLWLPDVLDPTDLYDFHRRMTERFTKTPKCLTLNGNAAEYLNQNSQAELSHWIKEGYYKLDSRAQVYRLTWKGAVLMGCKFVWPTGSIWQAWRRYQSKKLLRKLEE